MTFNRSIAKFTGSLFLLLCVLTLSGCSTFNRDWRAASKLPNPTDTIEGRWEGNWLSDKNGHNGKLRCLMTKLPDGKYEARFHAKYMKILSFKTTAFFDVKKTDTNFVFSGDADLGIFGVYSYDGTVVGEKFQCTYKCSYDHGDFKMSRPVVNPPKK
jgi:hypothetical protein